MPRGFRRDFFVPGKIGRPGAFGQWKSCARGRDGGRHAPAPCPEVRMSTDPIRYKLGKKPAHHDPRTLLMANYLALPAIPAARDWTGKASSAWGMMLNDQLGDCTCPRP